MQVSPNTKISALIKENPAAVDAIASINRHFEKLRNPVLRKLLASRVTIADAARIGNSSVEVFFEKLQSIGFEIPEKQATVMVTNSVQNARPEFLDVLPAHLLTELDVRDDILSGNDPFLKIMDAVEAIPEGGALCIINTFEPTPLIAILKKRGLSYHTDFVGQDLIRTYFFRNLQEPDTATGKAAQNDPKSQVESFGKKLQQYDGLLREVDVRHLEMPQPMVTILSELGHLPKGHALFVHHKRVPQMLLPQLQERGFSCEISQAGEGEVKLLIYR